LSALDRYFNDAVINLNRYLNLNSQWQEAAHVYLSSEDETIQKHKQKKLKLAQNSLVNLVS